MKQSHYARHGGILLYSTHTMSDTVGTHQQQAGETQQKQQASWRQSPWGFASSEFSFAIQ